MKPNIHSHCRKLTPTFIMSSYFLLFHQHYILNLVYLADCTLSGHLRPLSDQIPDTRVSRLSARATEDTTHTSCAMDLLQKTCKTCKTLISILLSPQCLHLLSFTQLFTSKMHIDQTCNLLECTRLLIWDLRKSGPQFCIINMKSASS